MSINLPHWPAEVTQRLGLNWPGGDEGQLRDAATHPRTYANDFERAHDGALHIVRGDRQEGYVVQSSAYAGTAFLMAGLTAPAIPQRSESEVVGVPAGRTVRTPREQIDHAVERLPFQEIAGAAIGGPPSGLRQKLQAIRAHGRTITNEADAHMRRGRAFSNRVGALTCTTGD